MAYALAQQLVSPSSVSLTNLHCRKLLSTNTSGTGASVTGLAFCSPNSSRPGNSVRAREGRGVSQPVSRFFSPAILGCRFQDFPSRRWLWAYERWFHSWERRECCCCCCLDFKNSNCLLWKSLCFDWSIVDMISGFTFFLCNRLENVLECFLFAFLATGNSTSTWAVDLGFRV
jgi:hypothetical protein